MTDLIEPAKADITYETDEPVRYQADGPVAWVIMNRPKYANAQNSQMTYALDGALRRAVDDDEIRVIILKGEGKHFSGGHDVGTPGRDVTRSFKREQLLPDHTNKPGAELLYTRGARGVPGNVPTLARYPEADHCCRPGCMHRRRSHVGLGL